MRSAIKAFLSDDSGTTMIEYGLIGAMVSVFAITALSAMGDGIADVFQASADSVNGALPS